MSVGVAAWADTAQSRLDGYTGATARFHPLNPVLAQIHQRLQAEFDPAGIFNRGRMYPQG
ncbi:hypothetical protein [Rhodoferax antarcticus]|uniref:hypothetical protein n=1 Tax=Rhodoferax antarcticus TaxID=81479 RepID=UPI00222549DC|nr:hypothetical protein [Rhodoferax antarcticus]MCW2314391.1 FAD/FMN-containing dehydrogenase [Rhodoferax antarcticus]